MESALRELKEELGISAVPEQLHFARNLPNIFARISRKMFRDEDCICLYFSTNINTDELILQTEGE